MALQPQNAELVIGIVARMGIETPHVAQVIESCLAEYGYRSFPVKVTDALRLIEPWDSIPETPIEERLKRYIKACDEVRKQTKSNDIMARFAVAKIQQIRANVAKIDPSDEMQMEGAALARRAYVLNQLKRLEESELLRSIYGEQYVQISCHSPVEKRARALAERISHDHHEKPRADAWISDAHNLISADDAEEEDPWGQRVRDIFPSSDVVIDASSKVTMERDLKRFFSSLFGDFSITPTLDEYGMELAVTAALRSSDLSRQVGAAILNQHREVEALGCNEVPKARGGTYWTGDDPDGREHALGQDSNDRRKREVLTDLAFRMRKAGILDGRYDNNDDALLEDIFRREDDLISDSQMMDSLEYGRTVHAEMNAITDAARNGHSVRGNTLYCNTFPCHNCAKHIVASGIARVVYLKPYPKSYASDLFSDSVAVDTETAGKKVTFEQFIGIFGPTYRRVFQKTKWKNNDGSVKKIDKERAGFLRGTPIPAYVRTEFLVSKRMGDLLVEANLKIKSAS